MCACEHVSSYVPHIHMHTLISQMSTHTHTHNTHTRTHTHTHTHTCTCTCTCTCITTTRVGYVAPIQGVIYSAERALNEQMLTVILQTLQFLGRQRLHVMGIKLKKVIFQVLKLRSNDRKEITNWLIKRRTNYTSPENSK